jgi:hypothetical protein
VTDHPELPWCFENLSWNPRLTVEVIEKFEEKRWEWFFICQNPALTSGRLDFVKLFERFPDRSWEFSCLSHSVPLATILALQHLPWEWSNVSLNPTLTINDVRANLSRPWHWGRLTAHININMEIIAEHPELPWDMNWVSLNEEFDAEMMSALSVHSIGQFEWMQLSKSRRTTMNFIDQHPEYPWHWAYVSRNPNLTMDIVRAHPDRPWAWDDISHCTRLSMDVVRQFPEKEWCCRRLSENQFNVDFKVYLMRKQRQLALLAVLDQTQARRTGEPASPRLFDLVFQSEYIVSLMFEYV